MIIFTKGSVFDADAQVAVIPVNTVGVMGAGLALEARNRCPAMYDAYKGICDGSLLDIGKLWLYRHSIPMMLCFPTKKHYRDPSHLDYISAGLRKFAAAAAAQRIESAAFPKLGCGRGGLEWQHVKPLMLLHLAPLAIPIYICE